MLDINTNLGSFSRWSDVLRFMKEESLIDIDVLSIYYFNQPLSTISDTFTLKEIEAMSKGDF